MMMWRSLSSRTLASALTWIVNRPAGRWRRRADSTADAPPAPLATPMRVRRPAPLVRHNR